MLQPVSSPQGLELRLPTETSTRAPRSLSRPIDCQRLLGVCQPIDVLRAAFGTGRHNPMQRGIPELMHAYEGMEIVLR